MRSLQITSAITNRDNASVEIYFSEIGRENMLTAQDEVELAKKIRQGDKVALERLKGRIKTNTIHKYIL